MGRPTEKLPISQETLVYAPFTAMLSCESAHFFKVRGKACEKPNDPVRNNILVIDLIRSFCLLMADMSFLRQGEFYVSI